MNLSLSYSFALPALFVSALVLGGCSGEVGDSAKSDGHIGRAASAIQGGFTDTSAAHNFAVGVANRYGGVCSGTLIAPNLVLTARHCVVPPSDKESVTCSDSFADNVAPSALYVTTEPNLYRAKAYYETSEIITPDDHAFCGNDIALIILAKSVPATEAAPAIPVVSTAEDAGSRATIRARHPPAFRARDTPTSIPAVPTPPQNAESLPSVCSRSSSAASKKSARRGSADCCGGTSREHETGTTRWPRVTRPEHSAD